MIDDVKELLSLGTRIRDAVEGIDAVKTKMRTRLEDYERMLQLLLHSEFPEIENELMKLRGLYEGIEALHVKHTADPGDPKWVKAAKKVNRGTQHKSIEEDLDAIDKEARQIFDVIATKSSINIRKIIKQILQDLELQRGRNTDATQVAIVGGVIAVLAAVMLSPRNEIPPIEVGQVVGLVLQGLQLEGVRATFASQVAIVGVLGVLLVVFSAFMLAERKALSTMVRDVLPPTLPQLAAVPAGALALPRSYVERPDVQEAVNTLINPDKALAPYTIFGMGGRGKTILASAVVRDTSVREHYRGGISWLRVGRGANRNLLPLLQGLTRDIGAAPTDTPHGVPHVLDSLEQVMQHLRKVLSTSTSPRLVVLDDVWEREVVEALLGVGLKVLVTTRDRSVVGAPGGWLELGDMTDDEALELLLKTSGAAGQPGGEVRTQMMKVVARCGRLPLLLAIAGSMSVVEGKGLTACAWEKLFKLFENAAELMGESGEESTSLDEVLGASFSALSAKKRKEFLKMAVLAPGAVAPIEMLRNLWETEDKEGAREEACGLTSKSLLQDVGGGGYRVHDIVLGYMKVKIKAYTVIMKTVTALQAHYLARLDVTKSYGNPEHGAGDQGWFVLGSLWRSVEELSGDRGLEVASYRASLGELESCQATADVASCFFWVGYLFVLQGKLDEAGPLYVRATEIWEKALGPDHPQVATALNNRAGLLQAQGKLTEAEPLYERCQAIEEKVLGPDHPSLATTHNNRAGLLKAQGKLAEAERLYERCQAIDEKVLGPEHPDLAIRLNNRAELLRAQGKLAEAGRLYERCQAIDEKVLGPEHPDLAITLNNRAGLLKAQGKLAEAERLYERCQAIDEKGNFAEAERLYERCQAIDEKGKYNEAIPLLERAYSIFREKLGDHHPYTVNTKTGLELLRQHIPS